MKLDLEELKKIDALIQRSDRILIIPHRQPDGDTLGSALGFYQSFSLMGKHPEIVCKDVPAEVFSFMPNIEHVKKGEPRFDYDAILVLDAGATHLTGFHETHPALFDKSLEVINIDHHPSNNFYGRYNIVDSTAASATMIVYRMLGHLGYPLDRHAATCLLTGLYTDTGSLQHSNTTSEALRIAAELLAKGANLRHLSKEVFNTTKISTMRLWGRIFKNTVQKSDGVTMSVVTAKDFLDTGAGFDEIAGAVDFVNSVPGSEYSVILTERDGKVKASLRTLKDEVDVAEVASEFGGGGHTKAAGFTLPGRLEKEIRWKVVSGK
ncbi:bifunctional oligoribonuclease/PAP phosphatase NrnA [Candidatus Peregrinibacteria bacterium]|nr:bifunctional oligoribonuclease/PAP phosphatase NrnA [Candidatus Peregrinibacteria bacterium]